MNNVQEILSHWPVIFSGFGDNSLIAGSPNRTENRFLFHDEEGIFYIAEGYSPRKQQYQIQQNRLLEFLAENLVPGIRCVLHRSSQNSLFGQVAGPFQEIISQPHREQDFTVPPIL